MPHTAYIQVLGTGTEDASPSILFVIGGYRFMINMGDGLQRLCSEHHARLRNTQALFLTRISSETVSGLPGLIITMVDGGQEELNIYGPPDTTHYIAAMRHYLHRRQLNIHVHRIHSRTVHLHKDTGTLIFPITVHPSQKNNTQVGQRPQLPLHWSMPSVRKAEMQIPDDIIVVSRPLSERPGPIVRRLHCMQLWARIHRLSVDADLPDPLGNIVQEESDSPPDMESDNVSCEVWDDIGGPEPPHPSKMRLVHAQSYVENYEIMETIQAELNSEKLEAIQSLTPPLQHFDMSPLPDHVDENILFQLSHHIDHSWFHDLQSIQSQKSVVSYIGHLARTPGKFDVKKAKALGIPTVPYFRQLIEGQTVTLESGRVITPDQVVGPSLPGPVFAIIDCPTPNYLDSLISNPRFCDYYVNSTNNFQKIMVMVHLSGRDVVLSTSYQEWCNRFGPETQHILLDTAEKINEPIYAASLKMNIKLNLTDPEIFPMPHFSYNIPQFPISSNLKWHMPRTLTKVVISPAAQCGLDVLECLDPIDTVPFQESLWNDFDNETQGLISAYKQGQFASDTSLPSYLANSSAYLLFLGTGSSIPSKYRNVTGMYLNVGGNQGMLLDCGEGSFGQLSRFFGPQTDYIVSGISCVWISHIHADHHLGLIRFLAKRTKLVPESVTRVFGPPRLGQWLREYEPLCTEPFKFVFVEQDVTSKPLKLDIDTSCVWYHMGFIEVTIVPVIHCPKAVAIVLMHRDGWKFVYSGDTRPCDMLVDVGANADILVHEATFEDELLNEAENRRHSTTGEALTVSAQMKAKFTLLTHFSQRYPKIPIFDVTSTSSASAGISFDLMCVPFNRLCSIAANTRVLHKVCADLEE